MPERIKVAYWTNSLGEEMSSRVHAEFTAYGDRHFIVVHDWREGTRGHGMVVLEREARDDLVVRMETPR